jgi:hypothetical protein
MPDIRVLSKEEILVLEEIEKGTSIPEIAEKFKISVEQTRELLRVAEIKRKELMDIAREMKIPTAYIRAVDDRINVPQKGTMKVGSQILKYLSEGIYSSPAGSLKELISNSFDSDSPIVELTIKENEVTIRDEGHGMNWRDFDEDFTFISRSIKRTEYDKTQVYNRPIIGFLGIGFISVSELCDTMIIRSCKKNEDTFFIAEIDFSKYRQPEVTQKEFYEVSEYKLTNYLKQEHDIEKATSFTEIRLKNLRPGFKKILLARKPFGKRELSILELQEYTSSNYCGITDLGEYWQMIWEIACMAPVRYPEEQQKPLNETISKINETLKSYNFTVKINGVELVKPIRFPMSNITKAEEYRIHPIEKSIKTSKGTLSFRGYIYSQHGMMNPKEYIGIMIRVKNVAIGGIDRTFLEYPSGANQLFRNWVFGEIYVEEGLEDALNINRNQFKITDPNYAALKEWLHGFLDEVVFKHVLNKYYRRGRDEKEEQRSAENKEALLAITKSEMGEDYRLQYRSTPKYQPLQINKKERLVIMNPEYPGHRIAKKLRPIAQRMLLLFEIALEKSDGDIERLRKNFREEIEKWLK